MFRSEYHCDTTHPIPGPAERNSHWLVAEEVPSVDCMEKSAIAHPVFDINILSMSYLGEQLTEDISEHPDWLVMRRLR